MSRVNYYQSAFNSQKEKVNILAEMLKISKSGLPGDLYMITVTIRAPVGANKREMEEFCVLNASQPDSAVCLIKSDLYPGCHSSSDFQG